MIQNNGPVTHTISLRWAQFDLLANRDLLRWFAGLEFW